MKRVLWISIFLMIVLASFGKSLYKVDGNSVIVDLDGISVKSRMLKVEVWSDKTVKIISGMDKEFSSFQSFIPKGMAPLGKFKVGYVQNNIEVTTHDLIVSVQEDGLVRIFNRDGNKLLIESDRFFEPLNSTEAKYKIKQRYFLNVHENIYGFGFDDSSSRYNLRGTNFVMKQNDSAIASPVVFSEKGYAVIWDNYSQTTLNDQKSGLEISSDYADEIQYFFIYGPTWDEIVTEMRNLTGNVPMLPRWSCGYWCNPEFYTSSESQQSKSKQYHSAGLPAEIKTTIDFSLFQEEKSFDEQGINERLSCLPSYPRMKGKYAEYAVTTVDHRSCIPTYTNYPGIQKFGTFLIAGEVKPTWESLRNQVSAASNLPLSGQPYWGTIIGGSQPLSEIGLDEELLTRWYQFAAFTPVFLIPKPDRDIFSIKSKTLSEASSNAIKLRYQLLPYIYSTTADVFFLNKNITRSLLFDYQKDEKVHPIDQQYLFGESMMVCPVSASSVTTLPVYFPGSYWWYDFFTGKQYPGSTNQTIAVTTSHIPIFIKSGSIIPLATIGETSLDSLSSPMEIRVYAGNDGRFMLYEDENDGNGYQIEKLTRIPFEYSEKDKTLSVGPTEGNFPGMSGERIFHLVMVSDSTGIGNEMSVNSKEIIYKGKKVKVKF